MREGLGRWIVIVILAFIAFSFIFFGIDFTGTTTTFAARVNGDTISLEEFDRVLQAQQNQYQQLYRIELTDDLRREIRANVIENLVRGRVLEQRVDAAGYRASDDRVRESIQSSADFRVGDRFSADVYRTRLATAGISPAQYEEEERTRLALQDLQDGILNSTFLTPAEFRAYIALERQRRRLGYATFSVEAFTNGIEISDADIEAHYADNGSRYMTDETVDIEYVEVSQPEIAANLTVSDEDLNAYYASEREAFETEEERSVRHILITESDEAAANAIAEEVLARLNAGESFEDLAREYSDDPGTRDQGGDLGRISRGMLVGPFEDAAFSMAEGEVRGPIRTSFGLHIIRVDAIYSGAVESFESVREDLLSRMRTERSEDLFYEQANALGDRAYYGDGDLATVAAELMLPLVSLNGFSRAGNPQLFADNIAVVQAAYSDEVLGGRNSNLIELGEGHVMVLRVTAHHEPTQRPLDEVREDIRAELVAGLGSDRALEAADGFRSAAATAEDLAALATEHGGTWTDPAWIERDDASVPLEVVSRAFALAPPAAGTPTWESAGLANGDEAVFALYEVVAGAAEDIPRETRDEQQKQLGQQAAVYELAGYAAAIRNAARVRVPQEVLEPVFY
jgi:peptidyl-prolyl cis-trans isomerase D